MDLLNQNGSALDGEVVEQSSSKSYTISSALKFDLIYAFFPKFQFSLVNFVIYVTMSFIDLT